MDQLFVANYRISSATLAEPTLALNLSVDPVRGSLRGHATVTIGEVQRVNFDVEGNYMALDGVPGVLSLRNTRLPFPVMDEPQLAVLIALPHGWKSGAASFIYTHGMDHTETRVTNAVATLCQARVAGDQ